MAGCGQDRVCLLTPEMPRDEPSPSSSSVFSVSSGSNMSFMPNSFSPQSHSQTCRSSPMTEGSSVSPVNLDDLTLENLSGSGSECQQIGNFQIPRSQTQIVWESTSSSICGQSEFSHSSSSSSSPPFIGRPASNLDSIPLNPNPLVKAESRVPPCSVCNSNYRVRGTYGAMVCDMCQHFFRQMTQFKRYTTLECKSGLYDCPLISWEKRKCPACRYRKCTEVGLKQHLVLDEAERRRKNRAIKGMDRERNTFPAQNEPPYSTTMRSLMNVQPLNGHPFNQGSSFHSGSQSIVPYSSGINAFSQESPFSVISIPQGITIGWTNELNSMEKQLLKELYNCNILYNGRSSDIPQSLMGRDPRDPAYQDELGEYTAKKASYGIVRGAKRLSGFRDLDEDDKVTLIKDGFVELMVLVTVLIASDDMESWTTVDTSVEEPISPETENLTRIITSSRHHLDWRRLASYADPQMYEVHRSYIESYARENDSLGLAINWRKSPLVMHLLAAIILMNPERQSLKARDKVRQVRQQYASLLRRLLFQESVLKARSRGLQPPSDANALYNSNIQHIERAERIFNLLFSRTYELNRKNSYYKLYFEAWAHLMTPLVHQILNIPYRGPPQETISTGRPSNDSTRSDEAQVSMLPTTAPLRNN